MANYADYIQFPDTVIGGNYVERYAFPDSTGMYTDSVAWYRTPEGYKVVDRADAKLYKQDHPEGRPYVAQTYSEDERQKLFNDAFGKSKIEDVEQKADGGILSQAPKELVELVQAAMSDESAAQKLSQLMSQRPDLADMVEQIAAELQGTQEMKCGGRVKKKALGSKLIKTQKAKCGCELKKVGGRLIEVDTCTGLPIHRHGGQVKKYQNAAGAIQRADDGSYYFKDGPASRTYTAAEAKERLGAVRHNGSYYYRSPEGKIYTQKSTPLNWAQSAGWSEMQKDDAGAYALHPEVLSGLGYQKRDNGSWGYGPAPAAPAQPSTPQTPPAPTTPTSPTAPAAPAAPAASSAAPGLFTGDLRSYGARRQWVTDNAEYLKSQGWDDARIAGYRGSAADNIALQKAISGKSAWDASQAQQQAEFERQREIDRQKQLAFENDMQNSRSVDAAGYRSRPVRTQPLTMQERYSQMTPWEREQITFSNDQLMNMSPTQAMYLPKMQYDQYLNLKFNR